MTAPTAFARIAVAMAERLRGLAPMVEVARMRVLPERDARALIVRPGTAKSDSVSGLGTPLVWTSTMQVECYARGSAAGTAAAAVDALLHDAVHAIAQEPTLGGLCGALEPAQIDWDYDIDGQQTACATVTFLTRHASGAATL